MSKPNIMDINNKYRKKELIKFVTEYLKSRTVDNLSWEKLPDCNESYLCLKRLNKTILIKIYECLLALD